MSNKAQNVWKKERAAEPRDPEPIDEADWEYEEEADSAAANPRLHSAREGVKQLTNEFRLFCKCTETARQIELLGQMQQGVKALRQSFSIAGLSLWAAFSSALSTFVFAIAGKPGFPTFSSFRTMADALDLLRVVVLSGGRWNGTSILPLTALIADEHPASRKALVQALQAQNIQPVEASRADQLLGCLRQQSFDVIFFDTALSDLDEFTLLTQLRKLPNHRLTPVILLTPLSDFESRASSLLSASCDFIAKPIAPTEAAVKAFVLGLKYRLEANRPAPKSAEPQPTAPAGATPKDTGGADLAAAEERIRIAEKQISQLTQSHAALEQELAARTQELQEAREEVSSIKQAQQNLRLELGRSSRRETQLRSQVTALEQQLEQLNQSLGETRQDLAQESERRLATEQRATELAQARARLEQQLAARPPVVPQVESKVLEIKQSQQALTAELKEVLHRETQYKNQCASLEAQLQSVSQDLGRSRQQLSRENERRLNAEQQTTQLTQARAQLEQELAARTLQLQQAHEQASELEKTHQSLSTELSRASRQETQLKHRTTALEQKLEALEQAADQARQDLAQESERRLAAEQAATKLERRLQELTRAEAALRQQFDQVSREQTAELEQVKAALRKETDARKEARHAEAEKTANVARLEQQLAEGELQVQQARERAAALEQARKLIQAELRGVLERQAQLEQQGSALDQQLSSLSRSLKPSGKKSA